MTAADVSLPKVPTKAQKVTSPDVDVTTAKAPEVVSPKAVLTYGEAVKLVASVLRYNSNSELLCEAIRDIVAGTGLDVSYETQEEEDQGLSE